MLLRKLAVLNNQGSLLDLPFADISGGFKVLDIQGLGPVKATLVSSSFASLDGAQYHSSKREPRNIIVKLGLAPDLGQMSVQQLRAELYNFFMPKTQSTLKFNAFNKFTESVLDQELDVEIVGRIESCEPVIFAKEPEVEVSIMCFNPDFVDPEPVIFSGSTVSTQVETPVPYVGSIETGVLFTIRPNRALDAFTIYYRTPDNNVQTIEFTQPLIAGDVLRISSVPGAKYARRTRATVETSLLYGVSPQSGWLELHPGGGNLRVHATGAAVPFDIEYTTKYGGL